MQAVTRRRRTESRRTAARAPPPCGPRWRSAARRSASPAAPAHAVVMPLPLQHRRRVPVDGQHAECQLPFCGQRPKATAVTLPSIEKVAVQATTSLQAGHDGSVTYLWHRVNPLRSAHGRYTAGTGGRRLPGPSWYRRHRAAGCCCIVLLQELLLLRMPLQLRL